MTLQQVFSGFADLLPEQTDLQVSGLTLDSRKVQTGDVFFALAGELDQLQQNIAQAVEKGAIAICVDQVFARQLNPSLPLIVVPDLAQQCSAIAGQFYGNPSANLKVIAVTGTNGKTSVSQFIAGALETLGLRCAVIGTLGYGRLGQLQETGMTTPDPLFCQQLLAGFVEQSVEVVVMEVSSHALKQHRIDAVQIDIAVLTNLSRDHLDYHLSMDDYAAAKARLFSLPSLSTVVINTAEAFGQQLLESGFAENVGCLTYQQEKPADWSAEQIQPTPEGLTFTLRNGQQQKMLQVPLLGRFNVDNVLATAAVLSQFETSFDKICDALEQIHSVAGRMERVTAGSGITVVVDYAHTPDALQQALLAMRQHVTDAAQLWCVFGCGGDRDTGKRPLMGHIASTLTDRVVLTDDNPRSESSKVIIQDILAGMSHKRHVHIEADREKAISYAIDHAVEPDMVLVAGKGHETFQERLGVKHPFSDIQVIQAALLARQQRIEAR